MTVDPKFIAYQAVRFPPIEMHRRATSFHDMMSRRRSVRHFSTDHVSQDLIELAIRTAGTAPSGANRQPWFFVAVDDPDIKRRIRIGAEDEERKSYEGGRMPREWRDALAPLGTTWRKPFLESAPWLIVVFEQVFGESHCGEAVKNYYVKESVGIACGIFVATLQHMGLATLTHTPSPMAFLNEILDRPKNERPFALFPVGIPTCDCTVPDIQRKSLDGICSWHIEHETG